MAVLWRSVLWTIWCVLRNLNVTVNFDTFIISFCSTGIWFTLGPDGHLLFIQFGSKASLLWLFTYCQKSGLGCLTAHAIQCELQSAHHLNTLTLQEHFLMSWDCMYKIMPLMIHQWEIFLDADRDMMFLFSPKYMEE